MGQGKGSVALTWCQAQIGFQALRWHVLAHRSNVGSQIDVHDEKELYDGPEVVRANRANGRYLHDEYDPYEATTLH